MNRCVKYFLIIAALLGCEWKVEIKESQTNPVNRADPGDIYDEATKHLPNKIHYASLRREGTLCFLDVNGNEQWHDFVVIEESEDLDGEVEGKVVMEGSSKGIELRLRRHGDKSLSLSRAGSEIWVFYSRVR